MTDADLVTLACLAMLGLAVVVWAACLGIRWVWRSLWDWHEDSLTTKRGDLR